MEEEAEQVVGPAEAGDWSLGRQVPHGACGRGSPEASG